MIHPDDRCLLDDWQIYGPQDEEIFELVQSLARKGIRVVEIEAMIADALRRKLVELDVLAPETQG